MGKKYGLFRKSTFLFLYILPVLLSLISVFLVNYLRIEQDVVPEIVGFVNCVAYEDQTCLNELSTKSDSNGMSRSLLALLIYKKALFEASNETLKGHYSDSVISQKTRRSATQNLFLLSSIGLLPFLLMGYGFSFKASERRSVKEIHDFLWRDFFMKYLVSFVVFFSWLYFFYPRGQAASAVEHFILAERIVSTSTSYTFISGQEISHVTAGFLGWFLYMLSYFLYRYYRGDFVSTRIYSILFKKFLFVWGISLIISSAGAEQGKYLAFIIGYFPLSAISILKEKLIFTRSIGEDSTALSNLPGITRWEIVRFEEENVDSIQALAYTSPLDYADLAGTISSLKVTLLIDVARLITVVELSRYTCLKQYCMTSSEFIRRCRSSNDAERQQFFDELGKCEIHNPEEIAHLLETRFPQPQA